MAGAYDRTPRRTRLTGREAVDHGGTPTRRQIVDNTGPGPSGYTGQGLPSTRVTIDTSKARTQTTQVLQQNRDNQQKQAQRRNVQGAMNYLQRRRRSRRALLTGIQSQYRRTTLG